MFTFLLACLVANAALRAALARSELPRKVAGAAMGADDPTMSCWINDKREVPLSRLYDLPEPARTHCGEAIAEAFGVAVIRYEWIVAAQRLFAHYTARVMPARRREIA